MNKETHTSTLGAKPNLWATPEDDEYEYYEPNSDELNTNNNQGFSSDDDYIHSTLVQRYNQETGQTTGLRNQAIFTLTALGFLVSMIIGFLGTNVFDPEISLPLLGEVGWGWYLIGSVSIIFCFLLSLFGLWKVELNSSAHYWKYPDDGYLKICMDSAVDLGINKRQDCRTLAVIIDHNSRKNQGHELILLLADFFLLLTFFCIIGVILNILLLLLF